MAVLPGSESRSDTDVVVPDGRTDIPMFFVEIFQQLAEHDPHAIVECKRLAGDDNHLCREYVVEGIDRFKSGKYGKNHAVGFMAGYVTSGSAEGAAAGVNAYLSRVARDAEHLARHAVRADVSWLSHHWRSAPSPPIDLHHALVTFVRQPVP